MNLHRLLILMPLLGIVPFCTAQTALTPAPGIPVLRQGQPFAMPWTGGLNTPQFNVIDLDQDGLMDLFLFDRTGNVPIFLLNTGTAEEPVYTPTRAYDDVYPFRELHDWVLLRDYNCDGKPDIFAYTNGGFGVYRNTSDQAGLSFTLVTDLVGSNYVPTPSPNLFITGIDLPGIADIDGDGDLDILTYSIWGNYVEYHKNLSMELYGHCDSLVYEVRSRCWGNFHESVSGSSITLDITCSGNVPDPELGPHGVDPSSGDHHGRAHSGSAILPLDLNGDGVMDLILGDFETPSLTALINGGTTQHAHMVGIDSLFPSYDRPVHLQQFLASFYIDIDGDGRRDLVVAPNSTTEAENAKGIWYYHNTGTDEAPHFEFQQEDLFQRDMLDFGEGARPVLFDHNGDGLMDLVVANDWYHDTLGSYPGRLALLENIGTATHPRFELVTTDYAGLGALDLGASLHPSFGDLTGDGRPDMVLGDLMGQLHLFTNVAQSGDAAFELASAQLRDAAGAVIDVGTNAAPQLFDLDGDGLLDLVVGSRRGRLHYYRNTGTAELPEWTFITDTLGGVSVTEWWSSTGFSVPFFHRDDQGQVTLYCGSESGGIHRYTEINGHLDGNWVLADSLWAGLREGWRTSVVLHDFTNSGDLSVVVGNYRGGLSFWSMGEETGEPSSIPEQVAAPFSLAPNPAHGEVELRWHAPLASTLEIELTDGLGRMVRRISSRNSLSRIPLHGLPSGLYIVRVSDGTTHWARRLAVAGER